MKQSHLFVLAVLTAFLFGNAASADMDAIKQELANSPDTAYLQSDRHDLIQDQSVRRQQPGMVVFQKTIDGIELHGGRVKMIMNEDGTIGQIFDTPTQNLTLKIGQPKLDDAMAELAAAATMHDLLPIGHSTQLVWFQTGDEAEIAWEVTTSLGDNGQAISPTHMITVVDAETGELLSQSQHDTNNYYANPNSSIYPRIVINNAIGAAGSRAYAAPFDAVVEVDFGCTGVLVGPNTVMCARHCGIGSGDTVRFGTNMNSPVASRTVQSSFLPDGGGPLLDGGDVSILRLTSDVPTNIAEPMRLIDATSELNGMLCALAGYGFNGVGSQGHNFTADGRRWGGENIIDRYGGPANSGGGPNIISTDFDNGSNGANQIPGSSPTPVEFEATTAPGDSGGPVMVQIDDEWLVAGVLSGGTTTFSTYGDVSWWTGTAIYRTQIEARGGIFYEEDPDPVYLGDINCDGAVNLLDITPFIGLVSTGQFFDKADINEDDVVNLLDVAGFIDLLNGN